MWEAFRQSISRFAKGNYRCPIPIIGMFVCETRRADEVEQNRRNEGHVRTLPIFDPKLSGIDAPISINAFRSETDKIGARFIYTALDRVRNSAGQSYCRHKIADMAMAMPATVSVDRAGLLIKFRHEQREPIHSALPTSNERGARGSGTSGTLLSPTIRLLTSSIWRGQTPATLWSCVTNNSAAPLVRDILCSKEPMMLLPVA